MAGVMNSFPRSRITRVLLESFKGFQHTSARFDGFTVVVGTNASGKSNLRDAFRFLQGIGRGYSFGQIFGEALGPARFERWPGLRGGPLEISYDRAERFAIEVDVVLPRLHIDGIPDGGDCTFTYRIDVHQFRNGLAVVKREFLCHKATGFHLFDTQDKRYGSEKDSDDDTIGVNLVSDAQRCETAIVRLRTSRSCLS